jgi:uncharacterized membrane protein YeaQ/YmgE (transglycosylase-associated protein family)
MRTDAQQGAFANILIGIVGAFIGGFISRMLGGSGVSGFDPMSLLLAIMGAVILLFFVRMLSGRGNAVHH